MKLRHILVGAVILILSIFVVVFFLVNSLLRNPPFPVFVEYLNAALWFSYEPYSHYELEKCSLGNRTLFLVKSENDFGVTNEETFDDKGTSICTNTYVINTCKQSCPYGKCINKNYTCDMIAGKYYPEDDQHG